MLFRFGQGGCVLTLRILLSHLGWVLLIPVNYVIICENDNVTLPLSVLSAGHHQRKHHLLQVELELPPSAVIG